MDPLSILGAAGVVVQIGDAMWKLKTLRSKYKNAHNSINVLINRLTSMKSVLSSIQDLIDTESIASPNHPRVKETLVETVAGCREAVESLDADISTFEERSEAMGISDRFRYVGLEKDMREREFTLQWHMAALQVSLQAVQCASYKEQTDLLAERKNQEIIQRAADETASLRASRAGSTGTRTATASVYSARRTITVGTLSVINDAESVDTSSTPKGVPLPRPTPDDTGLGISDSGITISTAPLQKTNLQHHTSSAGNGQDPRERIQAFVDSTPAHKRSRSAEDARLEAQDDEGYETKSGTDASSHLSPSWTPLAEREFRSFKDRAEDFDPADVYQNKSLNAGGNHVRTMSDPFAFAFSHQQASPKAKPMKKKLSLFSLRRSRTPSASSLESLEEEPKTRRRRSDKESEGSYFRSIDFGSPDGLQAPQLVRAAQSGSVPEVEQLLDRGAPIDAKHVKSGKTALAVAAHCGNNEIVDLLIQARATIDVLDATHSTPLHLAASRGHCTAMRLLLRANAYIEERDSEGRTPLWLAARHGYLPAVQLLVSRRAKVNTREGSSQTTPLHAAAMQGDVAMVELLLQQGAHIDAKDNQSMAAIHHACERGHEDVVEALLKEKASIESAGNRSRTPLITAAAAGQHHLFDVLLKRKAQLKAKSENGMTALHVASKNGHVEAVDLLLKKKLTIDNANDDGQTPLHLAIISNRFDVVELLLRKRCDVEKKCNRGYSPLHYSCASNNLDVMRILVDSGAQVEKASMADRAKPIHIATAHGDIHAVRILLQRKVSLEGRDAMEERPLCIACRIGSIEVVEALLDAGSPVRAKYSIDGWSHEDSPLCIASRRGHVEICSLLISRGASVRQRDEYDWQPLRYAAYYGHPEIVELLLQHDAELGAAGTGWGFEMTAVRIGFSTEPPVPQDRKDRVMQLLEHAEEQESISRQARLEEEEEKEQAQSMVQNNPSTMELMDRQNSVRVRKELLERRPSEVPTSDVSNVYPTAYDPPPPASNMLNQPKRSATTAGRTIPPPVRSVPLEGNPSPYNSIFDSVRSDNSTPPPASQPTTGYAGYGYGSSPSPAPFSTVSSVSSTPAPISNSGVTRAMTQMSSSRPSSTSQISRTLSGGLRYNSGISASSNRDSMGMNKQPDTIEEEAEFQYDNPDSFTTVQRQYQMPHSNESASFGLSEMPDSSIPRPPTSFTQSMVFEMPDTSISADQLFTPKSMPPTSSTQTSDPPPAYIRYAWGSEDHEEGRQLSVAAKASQNTSYQATSSLTPEAEPLIGQENDITKVPAGESGETDQYNVSAHASDIDHMEEPPQVTLNRINSDDVLTEPVVIAPRLRRFSFEQGDDSGRNTPEFAPAIQKPSSRTSTPPILTGAAKVPTVVSTILQRPTSVVPTLEDTVAESSPVKPQPSSKTTDEAKRRSDQEMKRRLLEDLYSQQELREQLDQAESADTARPSEPTLTHSTEYVREEQLPFSSGTENSDVRDQHAPERITSTANMGSSTMTFPTGASAIKDFGQQTPANGSADLPEEFSVNNVNQTTEVDGLPTVNPVPALQNSPPSRQPPPPPPPPSNTQPPSPDRSEEDRQQLWNQYRQRTQYTDNANFESEQHSVASGGAAVALENRAVDWEFSTDEEKIAAGGVIVFLEGVRYVFPP